MNPIRQKLDGEIDNALDAVREAKRCSEQLISFTHTIAMQFMAIEDALREVEKVDHEGAGDRAKILDRMRRIRELLNTAEIGSFGLDVKRKMDAAWERLNK